MGVGVVGTLLTIQDHSQDLCALKRSLSFTQACSCLHKIFYGKFRNSQEFYKCCELDNIISVESWARELGSDMIRWLHGHLPCEMFSCHHHSSTNESSAWSETDQSQWRKLTLSQWSNVSLAMWLMWHISHYLSVYPGLRGWRRRLTDTSVFPFLTNCHLSILLVANCHFWDKTGFWLVKGSYTLVSLVDEKFNFCSS